MRSDKHKDRKTGFGTFTKVWSILYLAVTGAFCWVLWDMNILPMKYIYIAAGVIALLILMTFPALYSRRFKKSRKVIALVLSILLMGVYGSGIVYMTGTMDFFSVITTTGSNVEEYYVLAKAGSGLEGAESIKGDTVNTFLTNEIGYSEARNQLKADADVEYEMKENLGELADLLTDDDAGDAATTEGAEETSVKAEPLVFVSEGHYTTICSENEGFKEKTEIVYTIEVKRQAEDVAKNVDVTETPFNVYVSGLDVDGTIDIVSRSDVNMVVTVNPKTHKVLLTSIPRDAYVALPGKGGAMDKLTHTGLYGVEESIAAVEELLGIDINYYVKVNYTTVKQLVDAIGGIDVNSDFTFVTHGMGVYYEFYEGMNHLDGSRALAFARERKSFPDGDFQRNRNQQLVLEAVLKKALSSSTILTKYTSILDAVADSVEINMTPKEMQALIKMQLDKMPSWDFERQSVLGEAASDICYSTGEFYTSVVYPDKKSIIEAVDRIVLVMESSQKESEEAKKEKKAE